MVDLELIILGALKDFPAHGYGLKQGIEMSYGSRYFRLSNSTLYRTLAGLESAGYIEGKKVPQENVPDRIIYQITEAGKRRLKELVSTPIRPSPSPGGYDYEFKVHAVYFGLLSKEERDRVTRPLYENAGAELKEALDKRERLGHMLDRFTLAVLDEGIEELRRKHQFYGRFMEME
jgi:DNA-binding PadR family transcriptional regulator